MCTDDTTRPCFNPAEYAKLALAVFPCHSIGEDGKCTCDSSRNGDCSSPGKHPRTRSGVKEATTDKEQISTWWNQHPDANVAIATGKTSGIVVVDVDPRYGGDKSLDALEEKLGPLPRDWSVATGGGGLHVYLSYPPDAVVRSRNSWAEGVDIKSDGGYVIAPPSTHASGAEYRWTSRSQPAAPPIPPSWLAAVTEKCDALMVARPATTDEQARLLQVARQYVDKAAGAPEGERNDAAFRLAGHLAAFQTSTGDRLGEHEILQLMSAWNERCYPPLPGIELQLCVSSALRNGKPRARKDVRLAKGTTGHGDPGEAEDKKSLTVADKLVELAQSRYRFGRTETDEAFAVELDGPNVAVMFRGSRDTLRSSLARMYRSTYGCTPSGTTVADALTALQGEAYAAEPEPVYLRVAEHDGGIVIDIGDSTGRAVVVGKCGWQVVDRSPVLFRRTAATGALPVPERGGSLEELKALLNVTDETWPLVVGWLIAAFVPNMPHPILMLGGQQGTGKSSGARKMVGVIDPSPAAVRSQPRDAETWAISAAASWVVAVDNVSHISDWWSDSLCKAVTGDGWLRRKLYTDGELAVLSFRRVILLTSIDAGALRGDLGDRVLLVDLEPIDEMKRRAERDIDCEYAAARPRILGALLDLLAQVWTELPHVHLDRLPRMADFGRLLAAMDRVLPLLYALDIYLGQRERIAETVVESDAVAMAVQDFVESVETWSGTAAELLEKIMPEMPPKGWPRTPQAIGARLKRLAPALEQSGVTISSERSGRKRTLTLAKTDVQRVVTVVTSSQGEETSDVSGVELMTTSYECDNRNGQPVTAENVVPREENSSPDDDDEHDNQSQPLASDHGWIEI